MVDRSTRSQLSQQKIYCDARVTTTRHRILYHSHLRLSILKNVAYLCIFMMMMIIIMILFIVTIISGLTWLKLIHFTEPIIFQHVWS